MSFHKGKKWVVKQQIQQPTQNIPDQSSLIQDLTKRIEQLEQQVKHQEQTLPKKWKKDIKREIQKYNTMLISSDYEDTYSFYPSE